jgi:hypothetical protein
MRKLILKILLMVIGFNALNIKSQSNTAAAAGAAVAVGASLIAANLNMEEIKRQLEHNAAEYLLSDSSKQNKKRFFLKAMDLGVTDKKDLSNTTMNVFALQYSKGPRLILIQKCSRGWINDYGLNMRYISYHIIDSLTWHRMLESWIVNINEGLNIKFPLKLPTYDAEINVSGLKNIYYSFTYMEFEFNPCKGINCPKFSIVTNQMEYFSMPFRKDFDLALEEGKFSLYFHDFNELVILFNESVREATNGVYTQHFLRLNS